MTSFTQYGRLFGIGLVQQAMPGIVKGILYKVLAPVTVAQAVEWVNCDKSLWTEISEKHRQAIKANAHRFGNVDWFTTDWVIESLKDKLPALTSLFLNWPEGQAWLAKQIEEIKREVKPDGNN